MRLNKLIPIMAGLLILCSPAFSQEETEVTEVTKDTKPMKYVFDNNILLDGQTVIIPQAKSFEFVIQHRFGNLNSKEYDFLGMFAASNIRIGLNYSIWNKFQIGVGAMKHRLASDLNWKWIILHQTKENRIPLFITYYGNATVEGLKKENYAKAVHRFNYFHQVIIGRKFHKNFSAQVNFAYAHFNVVDSSAFIPEGESELVNHDRKHDNFSVGLSGRIKVSPQTSVIFEYQQPLTMPDVDKPQPNLALGVEIATSSHSFQLSLGSYRNLLPQYNMAYNENKFWEGDIMLGFNITRLWNF